MPGAALVTGQRGHAEPLLDLGRLLRRRSWSEAGKLGEHLLVARGRADEEDLATGRGDEGVVRTTRDDHQGARAARELGVANPEVIGAFQDVEDLHEVPVSMGRVLGDDVVMEDEGAQRAVHAGTVHEDLRPVRAAEAEYLSPAGRDGPPVRPPA